MNRAIIQLGQSGAILIFIVIIGAIVGYLHYSGSDSSGLAVEPIPVGRGSIETFANFKIDFSILDNEIYKSLNFFGENPVNPGVTGEKKDPFAEFN